MTDIKPGKYRHYKGKLYQVIGVALQEDSHEEVVVYRALYDSKEFGPSALWTRPKEEFLGKVKVNGKEVPRFEFVE